jgi:hypothetical protein
MSVLSRELDSYQRAVDAYQRQLNSHNRKVDAYRDTLVRDEAGNLLVVDSSGAVFSADSEGKLTRSGLPSGALSDYGLTEVPDDPRFRMLRQNPTKSERESRDDVRLFVDSETGEQYYYTLTPGYGDAGPTQERLGPEWRLEEALPQQMAPGYGDSGGYYLPQQFRFSRDISGFTEKPPEWDREFNRQAPDPTAAQVRRAGMPTMAQIEGGLIGQVMRGGGVRQGVPAYRPRSN